MGDGFLNHALVCSLEKEIFINVKNKDVRKRFQSMRDRKGFLPVGMLWAEVLVGLVVVVEMAKRQHLSVVATSCDDPISVSSMMETHPSPYIWLGIQPNVLSNTTVNGGGGDGQLRQIGATGHQMNSLYDRAQQIADDQWITGDVLDRYGTVKRYKNFEEEILNAEVQQNEAISLSEEEIAVDVASSEGTMFGSGSGGEEVSDEILGIQSPEFMRTRSMCVVPVRLPKHSPEGLSEISSGCSGGLSGASRPFAVYTFYLSFSPHHMSSGSESVGDVVVPKFDMHVYTFVLTSGEVKNLVAEYAIPLDLYPCVPPSGLTMNMLSADKIGSLVLLRTSFWERRLRQDFQQVMHESEALEGLVFLIDPRTISDDMPWRHQDSSVADPAHIGVCAEDIRRLCENVIDLRPVHPAICYQYVLISQVLDGRSSHIPEKSDHQKVVEYENERVLAAKRKAQATKDRAIGKRPATEGAFQRPKKKKTSPLSFALLNSEANGSNRSGFGTYHSASPLNTIIPNEVELTTSGDDLILESFNRLEEDTDHHLDNVKDTTEVNSHLSEHSPCSQHSNRFDEDTHNVGNEPAHSHASGSNDHGVSSSSSGSHRRAFPGSTHAVRDQQNRLSEYQALQRSWFELGRGALAQIDILHRYEALNEDYRELFESHRSCQDVFDRLTETQNQLLEADLASKTSSLIEAEGTVSTLKGDPECLTVDLSHAEIVRHNYVRQLLPTVFQRLLSSDEYKKSMSDVFNLAIATEWSEGLKAACFVEQAEAILATATDYDPAYKATFMSEFDSLYSKSYLYVEKLDESFRLLLGDLQDMWRKGKCASLGHWLLDSSGASCVSGNVRHLTIGSWTHLKSLVLAGIQIA
nr:hypothetical protein [Tanacetum cinerariifolium]